MLAGEAAVGLAVGVLVAFIFSSQLAIQLNWPAYVVAVAGLIGIYPAVVALKYDA